MKTNLSILVDEGDVEVVRRSSPLRTAEVPCLVLHWPGRHLTGEASLGVLLVAGDVGPGYAEQN